MDLNTAINSFQVLLYEGFTSLNTGGLSWLNGVCIELTTICKYLHKFLIFDCKANDQVIDSCFLCLNQMICCIKYLERTLKREQQMKIVLAPTRQHFLDRLIWCLTRLKSSVAIVNDKIAPAEIIAESDQSFVSYMDTVLEVLTPLSLYSSKPFDKKTNISEQKAEYMRESSKIRSIIELLIGHILGFANVVSDSDRVALTTLCQKVMRECISFQKVCSLSEPEKQSNDQDKRVVAQVLENALYHLDKLVNETLLRTVFSLFVELDQNPINKMRLFSANISEDFDQDLIDEQIEKFDMVLDQLTQVGAFSVSYASNAKLKSNLRSCLASCEALDSCLIPSIFAKSSDVHSKLLEDHWWEEISYFRRCVQEIIDTDAFCLSLMDTLTETIKELNKTFDLDLMRRVLRYCDVFYEHLQINYTELNLHTESPTKFFFDDFKLMVAECKTVVEMADTLENARILKRLKILLSVLKKLEKTLDVKENNGEKERSFTFGDITGASRNQLKSLGENKITDSLAVAVDLDEFVKSFGGNKTPSRSSVFYKSSRRSNRSRSSRQNSTLLPNLKKDINAPKRSSKRTSLRVAMFKRQKSLETRKFLGTFSSDPNDSLNLQITDILEQLTDLSGSLFSKSVAVK